MRIGLFIPNMDGNGAERVTIELARVFSDHNHEVTVLLAQKKGPLLNKIPDKVAVVDLQSPNLIRSVIPLAHYLRHHDLDILFSSMGHTNRAALLAKWISGKRPKVVISEHTVESPLNKLCFKSRLLAPFMPLLYAYCDLLVCVSEKVKNSIGIRAKVCKCRVIYNPGVHQDLKSRLNHPIHQENDRLYTIISIGRLIQTKRFDLLIRVFSRVRQQIQNARLVILGEGPERPKLEALVDKMQLGSVVQIPGFCDDVVPWLQRSDLYVHCADYEGFGLVITEAMACGIPIVSTRSGGPEEILANGRYGRIADIGDESGLVGAILDEHDFPLCSSHELKRRAFDFDSTIIGEEYLEAFKGLL